jgi:hypothetical protein
MRQNFFKYQNLKFKTILFQLPYNTFGLVHICDPQKEIVVEERILLYYKYDNNPGIIK